MQHLQFLMNPQINQATEPTPSVELEVDDSVQNVTPITNTGNLSTVAKRPVSTMEKPTAFMTRLKVEALLKKEKEKAYVSMISLDLNPLYSVKIVMKSYLVRYMAPQFQTFDAKRGNIR